MCSKPTVWDGDTNTSRAFSLVTLVLSPPCGMATYNDQSGQYKKLAVLSPPCGMVTFGEDGVDWLVADDVLSPPCGMVTPASACPLNPCRRAF